MNRSLQGLAGGDLLEIPGTSGSDTAVQFGGRCWNKVLRDHHWSWIEPFVPGGRKARRGPRGNGRLFFDALLRVARSGGRWRDLPERGSGPIRRLSVATRAWPF